MWKKVLAFIAGLTFIIAVAVTSTDVVDLTTDATSPPAQAIACNEQSGGGGGC